MTISSMRRDAEEFKDGLRVIDKKLDDLYLVLEKLRSTTGVFGRSKELVDEAIGIIESL